MMFDLNKEREAFLNTFQYYKGRRDIIFSHEHELFMTRSNNPSDIAQKEISNMNSRWDAWLRCAKHRDAELEKAKAQAVPVWISADFMKPDEGNLVLGISTTKLAKFNVYQVVALDEFDECAINYWMPLPTAPSESGAEQ